MNTKQSVVLIVTIFTISLASLCFIYASFPTLNAEEKAHIKIPKKIEDAKQLGRVLSRYKDEHYYSVLLGISLVYIFLQSFAIPGSIFLSILCGYLFTFPLALIVVCTCSALGASLCYLLSHLFGRPLILYYFPERVETWSGQVSKHRDNLLYYMLFLRMTPLLPNWFINLASPILEVPLTVFFGGTFAGVAPPSVLFVQAGRTLFKLTSSSPFFTWKNILAVGACAVASLAPVAFKQRFQKTTTD